MLHPLIPTTKMEINFFSNLINEIPLSPYERNLTKNIFQAKNNILNQQIGIEDFFQANICEKNSTEQEINSKPSIENSEVQPTYTENKDGSIYNESSKYESSKNESSSLGFSSSNGINFNMAPPFSFNSIKFFDSTKKSHENNTIKFFDSNRNNNQLKSIEFEKNDFYSLKSDHKYSNYKYVKYNKTYNESNLTGFSNTIEKSRKNLLKNQKGLEFCLQSIKEEKDFINGNLSYNRKCKIIDKFQEKVFQTHFKNSEKTKSECKIKKENTNYISKKWVSPFEHKKTNKLKFSLDSNEFNKTIKLNNNIYNKTENIDKKSIYVNEKNENILLPKISENKKKFDYLEVLNDYRELIEFSYRFSENKIIKGKILKVLLFKFYPFLNKMNNFINNQIFKILEIDVNNEYIDLKINNFVIFQKIFIYNQTNCDEAILFITKVIKKQ